jgi:hypothetical protein
MGPQFPCPCCGYLVFTEPPGSYGICPICSWEDDPVQLRFARMPGGANEMSLLEAQQNFAKFGSKRPAPDRYARQPNNRDTREKEWRPLNEETDNIEDHEIVDGYRALGEDLYYWRPTYWRRKA